MLGEQRDEHIHGHSSKEVQVGQGTGKMDREREEVVKEYLLGKERNETKAPSKTHLSNQDAVESSTF